MTRDAAFIAGVLLVASCRASRAEDANLTAIEVAQAVMVTAELDFSNKPPTIAQALLEIERRYEPADGRGRTFAILDAFGEPTGDGKLHISMHVSTEKPGVGQLVFRRTGETLWKTRIVPATHPAWSKKSSGSETGVRSACAASCGGANGSNRAGSWRGRRATI